MVAVLGEQIGPKRYNHGRRKRDFLRSARRWRETFRPPRETERHSTGGLNAARHRELSQGLPRGFRPSQLAGRTPQGGPMHTVSLNAIPALTTEEMRAVDRAMVEDLHIELVQMMENAGRTLADLAITRFSPTSVTVLAGPGGNGGGGLVAARHLANRGCQVQVVLSEPDRLTPVPAHQADILARMGLATAGRPAAADLVIDALIGYGLRGNPAGAAAELITWANDQPAPVLALDTPSGLDPTTRT